MKKQLVQFDSAKTGLDYLRPYNFPARLLTHEIRPDKNMVRPQELLEELFADSKLWFLRTHGQEFDRYSPDHGKLMKTRMWRDPRMSEALQTMGLPTSEVERIYLPWWIEVAANHLSTIDTRVSAHAILGYRHSYQTQMLRQGLEMPGIASTTVAGFVRTSDDFIVLGLRGGLNFPNTYYFSAGALGISPDLVAGRQSIFDFYVAEELQREYALEASDLSSAHLLCQVKLGGKDRDVSFVFLVETPLTLDAILARHSANKDEDRKEHFRLFGVKSKDIQEFVRMFYKGIARNDLNRTFEKRVLLAQGAAPLLFYTGASLMQLEELASCYPQPV
jgi:hypothetical protein